MAAEEVRIDEISLAGEHVVETRGGVTYVWSEDPQTLRIHLSSPDIEGTGHYEFCVGVRIRGNDTARTVACRSEEVAGSDPETVAFSFDQWPTRRLGRQTLEVTVRPDTLEEQVVASGERNVHVLRATGDLDGDGLANQEEVHESTNFSNSDTDDDGLSDPAELRTHGTDPTRPDTDGDGLDDGPEVYTHVTDPTAADSDGDGRFDGEEVNRNGTNPNRADTDGDGLDDAIELNTYNTDPAVGDTDGDGLDDRLEVNVHATNPNRADTDGDGLADPLEVYTYETNPNAVDTDGDGLEDGPEVDGFETDPTAADTDGDGLEDGPELNTHLTNANAADTDGDGLVDGGEVSRFETNPNKADTDGDGVDDRAEVGFFLPVRPPSPPLLGFLGVAGIGLVFLWYRRGSDGWLSLPDSPLGTIYPDGGLADRLDPAGSSTSPRRTGSGPDARSAAPDDDPLPLANDDRVLALLSERGGRMRQSAIVEETDWSKSKVSRVLSSMEEEGAIRKIDVGRGNIISIPGEEPSRSRPPFDGR